MSRTLKFRCTVNSSRPFASKRVSCKCGQYKRQLSLAAIQKSEDLTPIYNLGTSFSLSKFNRDPSLVNRFAKGEIEDGLVDFDSPKNS
jgi:hypothetical protein